MKMALVHWDDPEGWYGEGGGRRVQDGFSFKNLKRIKNKKKKKKENGLLVGSQWTSHFSLYLSKWDLLLIRTSSEHYKELPREL